MRKIDEIMESGRGFAFYFLAAVFALMFYVALWALMAIGIAFDF